MLDISMQEKKQRLTGCFIKIIYCVSLLSLVWACPSGSGFRLYSRLTKTTAKKPCFSKSGDIASIPHATKRKVKPDEFLKPVRFAQSINTILSSRGTRDLHKKLYKDWRHFYAELLAKISPPSK
ncbi:hypothetical protein FLAPXU55_00682 [Flavobacterium panici]|uniref:Uncharacterized protein n=1 Tax=Flavobacterium panici TaxID=2654843 RepID=A0A9N8J066_9FLAO|nr:hypothetical protein FLAPXU55_00682 [Flavobacterium panici]